MEKQLVLDQDLKDEESAENQIESDKMWFIISSDWLY